MAGTILRNALGQTQSLAGQPPSINLSNHLIDRNLERYFPTPEQQPIDTRPTWDQVGQLQYERELDRQSYERMIQAHQSYVQDMRNMYLNNLKNNLSSQVPSGIYGAASMDMPNNYNDLPEYAKIALKYAKDWKYSQKHRCQPGYGDCSSLFGRAMSEAGYNINPFITTPDIPQALIKNGFQQMPYDINKALAGDILWKNGHVEIYLGDGRTVALRNPRVHGGVFTPYKGMATHMFRRSHL